MYLSRLFLNLLGSRIIRLYSFCAIGKHIVILILAVVLLLLLAMIQFPPVRFPSNPTILLNTTIRLFFPKKQQVS